MRQLHSILLITSLFTSLAEFAVANHGNEHSTPAFTTLKVIPTLSCHSIASPDNSACSTVLPGIFPLADSHWSNTTGISRSLPTGIAENNTHHWPGRVSNASHEHKWPSSSTLQLVTALPNSTFPFVTALPNSTFPFVTARPIKADLPSESAGHHCRGYLVSCIAALLTIYLYVL